MDIEKQFWNGHRYGSKWYGILWDENKQRLTLFWLLAAFVMIVFFYGGMWIADVTAEPIEVHYITAADADKLEKDAYETLGVSENDAVKTILLLGCDKRSNDTGRSDTIMVAFLHSANKTIDLLSIPRDTYVQIPKTGERTKINHAYAYGGVPLARSTVENYLGIEIDNYAEIDFNGFKALVDALGGIEIDVEKDMKYRAEGIDLKAGLQTLNGDQALQYVRFRSDAQADIGRIGRQQKFMRALAEQLLDLSSVWKLPQLISAITNNAQTDLTTEELLALATIYKDASIDNMQMEMLPGEGKYINNISYWIVDNDELTEIVDRFTNDEIETQTPADTTDDATAPTGQSEVD